ncbi:hypothetical protein KKH43_01610 [Patescibacteria group bacterium]|nr:hypothetical protein [Patescibacteria group bacterium]
MPKGEQSSQYEPETEPVEGKLSDKEKDSITLRASVRREQQNLKVEALNLEQPGSTEAMKETYERTLQTVNKEASGEAVEEKAPDGLLKESSRLEKKAREVEHLFPNLAAFLGARATKLRELSGQDYAEVLSNTKDNQRASKGIPKIAPSSLLPDAILLGMKTRQVRQKSLPDQNKIALAVSKDEELLKEYALVLPEEDRAAFLDMIPEEKRLHIARLLDASASSVLHQSLLAAGSEEAKQRMKVRSRLNQELRGVVESGKGTDKKMAKILAESLGELGEDTRQLLLEIMRDEYEEQYREEGKEVKKDFLPRVMKVFLDNFEDFKGNDIVLHVAGDKQTNRHLSIYLLGKLIKNGYLPKDVGEWWNEGKEEAKTGKREIEDEKEKLAIIKSVVTDLEVIPSREILEFIANDEVWHDISLSERIEKIKASQEEFAQFTNNRELVSFLHKDEKKALTYYLLHGGEDRFNLINNYDFSKFKEVLELIAELEIHETPVRQFQDSLIQGGMAREEARDVVNRLRGGHFPLKNLGQASQEISFDVTENAAVKNANVEIGQVLGRKQLGTVLLFPLYREYLEGDGSEETGKVLQEMSGAHTFAERTTLLERIEEAYPDIQSRAQEQLKDNWKVLGEKMVLELSLNQIFGEESVPVRGEELIPRLDSKRLDLKRIKKDLLVALKGGNERIKSLQRDISKKKKARGGLQKGVEKQEVEEKKTSLIQKVTVIDQEVGDLEKQLEVLKDQKIQDRFADLSEEERKVEVDVLGKEILALTEKSPSAIFTYLTMQVLGEERLRESDVALVQEMESHLQGPFQTITDFTTYQKPRGKEEKKRMHLNLKYVDKGERLLNAVRFADSKICCFSSSNYDQVLQHDMPNKFWVASINADPLSFILSLEIPPLPGEAALKGREVKENIGFIFGSFGVDEEGNLALMQNGIYYAPTIENEEQSRAILKAVERMFDGLNVKTMVIGAQHGGLVPIPTEYTNEGIELTRLRPLDDNHGDPETDVYDDLGTGSDLNKPHTYGEFVWHKSTE